jgi:hypothetical protein
MKQLESQHKAFLNSDKRDPKQRTLLEVPRSSLPAFSVQLFEEYLIDWIVMNNQSFSEVDSKHFKRLLGILKPGLDIISSSTVKRRILDRYTSKLGEMNFF